MGPGEGQGGSKRPGRVELTQERGRGDLAETIAARGEPVAATALRGAGHAMVVIGGDGLPKGSHLRLLHVSVEGARAAVDDCVLRLGQEEGRSCPPPPLALVDCATWSVPADAVRSATLAARAVLFVRIY